MTTATPSQILRKARKLIADPEHWTQGSYAREAQNGASTTIASDRARCFCSIGALERAAFDTSGYRLLWNPRQVGSYRAARACLFDALADIAPSFPVVVSFNDDLDTTHADVLALFDRAIALAEDKEI